MIYRYVNVWNYKSSSREVQKMALVANLLFIMFDYCVIGIVCTRPAWKHCQQPIRDGLLVSLEMYCNLKRRLRTCLEKKNMDLREQSLSVL